MLLHVCDRHGQLGMADESERMAPHSGMETHEHAAIPVGREGATPIGDRQMCRSSYLREAIWACDRHVFDVGDGRAGAKGRSAQ